MITLCLIAAGLSVLVFLQAVRGAGDGHEDDLGFHADPKAHMRSRQAVRSSFGARADGYLVPRASPWLRLPVHGQDEIDLLASRAVIRINSRSPI